MMAENDSEIPEGKKPPKIKLGNGNGNGKSDSDKIPNLPDPFSPQSDAKSAPPKVSIPIGRSKEATSPLDPSPTGISRPKDETAQISPVSSQDDETVQEGKLADPQSETARIDLSKAVPAGAESNDMEQTMRVDLTEDPSATESIPKISTSRVDQTGPVQASPDADPFDAGQTMQIDIPESSGSATQPLIQEDQEDEGIQEGVPVDPSNQTMRIDLSEQPTESDPLGQTKPIDESDQTAEVEAVSNDPQDESAATLKIDLPTGPQPKAEEPTTPSVKKPTPSATDAPSKEDKADKEDSMKTMRVDLSKPEHEASPATAKISPADESQQTMRINISEGVPSEPKSDTARIALSETQSVKQATSPVPKTEKPNEAKSKSGTILLGESGELGQILEEETKNASSQTMRIELDEDESASPGSTSKAKTDTVGIDMSELMTTPSGASKGPKAGSPKTIRIRKADSAPPTRVLKKAPSATQEEKSGTTKVEIPSAGIQDSNEKKTIRVKRNEAGVTSTGSAIKPKKAAQAPESDAPSIGIIYTLAAVLAIIITGIALYVMAAQIGSIPTDGTSLPWPGQI